jgi:hypothetical protein
LVVTFEHKTDHGSAGNFGDNASDEARIFRARAFVDPVHAEPLELVMFDPKGRPLRFAKPF